MINEEDSKLINSIKEGEGFRSKPYRCTAGKLSIGYGRNLDDGGISRDEAETLLKNDVREAIKLLDRNMPGWKEHPLDVQRVLIEMAFNLWNRLFGFKKMYAALKEKNYYKASLEMTDSLWARQVGDRAKRLTTLMREAK